MSNKTLIILILIIILIVTFFLLIYLGNFFYNYTLNPKNKSGFLADNESNDDSVKQWMGELSNDVYITNRDNLTLHAYRLSNPSNLFVILCHGYRSNGISMSHYAQNFYDKGYNILIPDARAHGLSEGNYVGMGWHERNDIIEWSNFLINQNSSAKIILMGLSMGASTVMMATGESLSPQIKLVIEDCGYTSVWEEFKYQLKTLYGLPSFPILNLTSLITKYKAGYFLSQASAINQIGKCKIPILFIHGDKDKFVPFIMQDKLYMAANCEKEKLIIYGAGHTYSVSTDPEKYWDSIEKFIQKHLPV